MIFLFYVPQFCNYCGANDLTHFPVLEWIVLILIGIAIVIAITPT